MYANLVLAQEVGIARIRAVVESAPAANCEACKSFCLVTKSGVQRLSALYFPETKLKLLWL